MNNLITNTMPPLYPLEVLEELIGKFITTGLPNSYSSEDIKQILDKQKEE